MPEPLVLLHGIGSHLQMWAPVVPLLEPQREIHALDLPGFGERPPLPAGVEPSPAELAKAVAAILDERGIDRAHVAGNSLGGWVALELAKLGRTLSVCALSPAGFAQGWERAYSSANLRGGRALTQALTPVAHRVLARPGARKALFSLFFAHPERMTPAQAAASARNLARSPGWRPTLRALERRTFTGGADVPGPVTVAWGAKDRLLLPRQAARARAALPHGRHILLAGCGHVPTWDDPAMVADAILTSA